MEAAAAEQQDSSDGPIDIQNLQFHEKLGRGGYGSVNRVTFKIPYKGHHEAAAKSVMDFQPGEVEIMTKMCHPHIVELLGVYENGPINVIIMEYACNGSLHDYLMENQDTEIPHDLIRKWAQESAVALQYLHQNNILHRDIKVQNCLLFQDGLLKLCDFGIAKELDYSLTTSSQKGTYRYMSPEILRGNKRGRSVYSRKSDIYAYGMLLLEICTKKPPFDNLEYGYIVFNVGRGKLQPAPPTPKECPREMIALIRQCWDYTPSERPDIDDFIQGRLFHLLGSSTHSHRPWALSVCLSVLSSTPSLSPSHPSIRPSFLLPLPLLLHTSSPPWALSPFVPSPLFNLFPLSLLPSIYSSLLPSTPPPPPSYKFKASSVDVFTHSSTWHYPSIPHFPFYPLFWHLYYLPLPPLLSHKSSMQYFA